MLPIHKTPFTRRPHFGWTRCSCTYGWGATPNPRIPHLRDPSERPLWLSQDPAAPMYQKAHPPNTQIHHLSKSAHITLNVFNRKSQDCAVSLSFSKFQSVHFGKTGKHAKNLNRLFILDTSIFSFFQFFTVFLKIHILLTNNIY